MPCGTSAPASPCGPAGFGGGRYQLRPRSMMAQVKASRSAPNTPPAARRVCPSQRDALDGGPPPGEGDHLDVMPQRADWPIELAASWWPVLAALQACARAAPCPRADHRRCPAKHPICHAAPAQPQPRAAGTPTTGGAKRVARHGSKMRALTSFEECIACTYQPSLALARRRASRFSRCHGRACGILGGWRTTTRQHGRDRGVADGSAVSAADGGKERHGACIHLRQLLRSSRADHAARVRSFMRSSGGARATA